MLRPSQSPDFHPVEHSCKILERRDIQCSPPPSPKHRNSSEFLSEEQRSSLQYSFQRFVPECMEAVLAAHDGPTPLDLFERVKCVKKNPKTTSLHVAEWPYHQVRKFLRNNLTLHHSSETEGKCPKKKQQKKKH